jgi:hypothetical protein
LEDSAESSIPDLLQLVKQRFVADPKLLCRPLAVPACPLQRLQNQLPFSLLRSRPRHFLQREGLGNSGTRDRIPAKQFYVSKGVGAT